MSNANAFRSALITAALTCLGSPQARAAVLTNGGFESGLTGWTSLEQVGSDGTFFAQTGTMSPVNGFTVPAPPAGSGAAMTDATAGGGHALYQDFVVPSRPILSASAGFSLYLNNRATSYFIATTLDWAATNLNTALNLNQQARVDIMTTTASVFSIAGGDVLQNLFQTTTMSPAVSGYDPSVVDITALLQAHPGETLRLRFAETDNVNFFTFGADAVSITIVLRCPADLNGDGTVGSADLALLLGAWGAAGDADLNDDGTVGSGDLALLLGAWGPCPP